MYSCILQKIQCQKVVLQGVATESTLRELCPELRVSKPTAMDSDMLRAKCAAQLRSRADHGAHAQGPWALTPGAQRKSNEEK